MTSRRSVIDRSPLQRPLVALLLAVLLAMSFVGQAWSAAYHAATMATGTAVCTSRGNVVLDSHGQPVTATRQACGDCCGAVTPVALPPSVPVLAPHALQHAAPADMLTAQRLAAQWLAPLSRGPPFTS